MQGEASSFINYSCGTEGKTAEVTQQKHLNSKHTEDKFFMAIFCPLTLPSWFFLLPILFCFKEVFSAFVDPTGRFE